MHISKEITLLCLPIFALTLISSAWASLQVGVIIGLLYEMPVDEQCIVQMYAKNFALD